MTEQDPDRPEGPPGVDGQPGIYLPAADAPAVLTEPAADIPVVLAEPGAAIAAGPVAAPQPPRKSIVLPAVLALVLFLAAGAFVALWLIERGDHKATTEQLSGVRTEIVYTEKKTGAAETAVKDAEIRLKEAETGLAEKQTEAEKHKPCSDVGRELYNALDDRAIDAALRLLVVRCG